MAKRQEFRVSIDGIDLDERTVGRIAEAIQSAALSALAGVDFKGDFAARIGDGGTQGITVVALTEGQAEQVGLRRGGIG
jgi:hypothetical protein